MTAPYRVLVTGSRTWEDHPAVCDALAQALWDAGDAIMVVVHGDCPDGADAIAAWWCRQHPHLPITQEPHRPGWEVCVPSCRPGHRRRRRDGSTYCPSAGLRRDAEMVHLGADVCLAFINPCAETGCRRPKPHGSHGTVHTADLAHRAGIPVRPWPRGTSLWDRRPAPPSP